MNFELFIAKRIIRNKSQKFSTFIVTIAITATALSLAVMLIAISTITGFKKEISDKVFGFWGHIHIKNLDFTGTHSFESTPVRLNQNFYPSIDTLKEIRNIQVFATKPGIIKTNAEIEGIILKGVGKDFNWSFMEQYLVEGTKLDMNGKSISDEVLISSVTAARLNLKLEDHLIVYFIQQPPRVRKFKIKGIYKTGLEEYDRLFVIVDIGQIQRLNDWNDHQVGGFEIFLNDIKDLDRTVDIVYNNLLDISLDAKSIKDINPNIFDWLELQNINQNVILLLMTIVAGINLITALLILILERTSMIGILKSLGATNWSIRKVFIYNAAYILGWGLIFGNIFGIGLCLIQKYFQVITLPEESYNLSFVPVNLNIGIILLTNAVVFIINIITLIFPTYLITRIQPIKALRFT